VGFCLPSFLVIFLETGIKVIIPRVGGLSLFGWGEESGRVVFARIMLKIFHIMSRVPALKRCISR
jgi:hypothetical protein